MYLGLKFPTAEGKYFSLTHSAYANTANTIGRTRESDLTFSMANSVIVDSSERLYLPHLTTVRSVRY